MNWTLSCITTQHRATNTKQNPNSQVHKGACADEAQDVLFWPHLNATIKEKLFKAEICS